MQRSRLIAVAILVLALVAANEVATAETFSYQATLTAAETVPPIASDATGSFTLTLDDETATGSFHVSVPAIEDAIIGHIHLGSPGEAGPAVVLLFEIDPPLDTVDISGELTPDMLVGPHAGDPAAFLQALQAGQLYVNVHTIANPAEEIRGQIVPAQAAVQTPPTEPMPPASGNAGLKSGDAGDSSSPWGIAFLGLASLALVAAVVSRVRAR